MEKHEGSWDKMRPLGMSGGLSGGKARGRAMSFPKEGQEQGCWGIRSPVRALSGLRGEALCGPWGEGEAGDVAWPGWRLTQGQRQKGETL